MNATEQAAFDKANDRVHPVTSQWHYPIMTMYGYVPDTKEAKGLVRVYHYTHPETEHTMTATTGVSADYWEDLGGHGSAGGFGYYSSLESHLKKLSQ